MAKPSFHRLLCRMSNGTVSTIRTHVIHHDRVVPLTLSPRQHAVIHRATKITAPDSQGNATLQTQRI